MNNNKLKPFIVGGIIVLLSLGIAFATIDRRQSTPAPSTSTPIVQNTTSGETPVAGATIVQSTTTPVAKPVASATLKSNPVASVPTPVAPTAGKYTSIEVAKHNSPADCWTIVNGSVYNLTSWINQHPGGAGAIKALCGTDGSANFNGQHGGQNRPESELAKFKIGVVIK